MGKSLLEYFGFHKMCDVTYFCGRINFVALCSPSVMYYAKFPFLFFYYPQKVKGDGFYYERQKEDFAKEIYDDDAD